MGSDVGLFGTDVPDPDADVAARLVLAVAVRATLALTAATF